MKAAAQRVSQGLSALLAFASAPEFDLARRHLSSCEFAAFRKLSRAEQLHSLAVLRQALKSEAAASKELVAAALLHDVGKARHPLALWQKTLAVLLDALAPAFCSKLSEAEEIRFWRAPFIVRRRHPRWGGEILRRCNSSAAVIWLVEHHQDELASHRDHEWYNLLARLQRADGEC
ncbi:MAG: HD domain-containing protein [Chloroflexi bacterium]|nr:HD domain-containing protein [Chloroflexota bacterium]